MHLLNARGVTLLLQTALKFLKRKLIPLFAFVWSCYQLPDYFSVVQFLVSELAALREGRTTR